MKGPYIRFFLITSPNINMPITRLGYGLGYIKTRNVAMTQAKAYTAILVKNLFIGQSQSMCMLV